MALLNLSRGGLELEKRKKVDPKLVALKKLIELNGLTQAEIADKAGCHKSLVNLVFKGERHSPAIYRVISENIKEKYKKRLFQYWPARFRHLLPHELIPAKERANMPIYCNQSANCPMLNREPLK